MEVISKKRAGGGDDDLGGVIIRVPSITSIEAATDGKTTIITDSGIGVIDKVDSHMTMGGPDGIVVNIGSDIVIKTKGKTGAKVVKGSAKIKL